jgi:tripartite-type tricarboxylate transporter receptor subunit TctC
MRLIASLACLGTLIGASVAAAQTADDFPNKTITITNLYAAGGGTDVVARAIGQKLTEKWKVPVIIESKPGAGGTIAAAYVARQPADGYNLFVTDVSFSIVPSMYTKLTYDPLKDLVPLSLLCTVTQALTINPEVLSVDTVKELVEAAKKNPNKLTYASAGVGSLTHVGAEMFKKSAGVDIQHVPYRGAVPAITDVVAGRINMYFGALATPLPQIETGKLRALAVMQNHRSPLLPNVPSIVEAGYPDLDFGAYYGIFAPAGTPKAVLEKLAAGIKEALSTPEVKKTLDMLATEAVGEGPDQFAAFLQKDIERWRKVVQAAGVPLN